MSEVEFKILDTAPPILEFIEFREKCGWGTLDTRTAKKTLAAGIANVTAYEHDKVVGFGRAVGDGAIYFYIQDLIVSDHYQGQNLGSHMLIRLISQIKNIADPGASIGLMSANNKEPFYEKAGFTRRPNQTFGAGMTLLLDDK